MLLRYWLAAAFAIASPESGITADFSDPDWPCIQRKVATISIGQMWPYPIESAPLPAEVEAEVDELASRLVLRRTSLEEAEVLVSDFVMRRPETDAAIMGKLFERVFNPVNLRRAVLMDGIARYARKQARLSEQIDGMRAEMRRIEDEENPDFDKLDALEEKLDWDQRIFEDRAKSLTYVCETPVLLEKRIYAIGQILLRHLPQ